jgi:membrane dipeptidase
MVEDAVIIDGTCPGDTWRAGYQDWIDGGFSACVVSVGGTASSSETCAGVGEVYRMIRDDPRLVLALTADDLHRAHETGRLAVLLHFQGTQELGEDPGLVEVFSRLGVQIMGLAYNRVGAVCDGCEVPDDGGLTTLGRAVVAEMDRLGVLVDLSHTGWRSSADALSASAGPCVATHSNAHAVRAHPRNLPDDLIRGIAESGGVIGMNGFPAFVAESPAPTLDHLIDHMVHIDSLVGPGHVALGLDYCVMDDAEYRDLVASGEWNPDNYPPPPWNYPAGIPTARTVGVLGERMKERGYADDEIRGVLGENWLRLFDRMWPTSRPEPARTTSPTTGPTTSIDLQRK